MLAKLLQAHHRRSTFLLISMSVVHFCCIQLLIDQFQWTSATSATSTSSKQSTNGRNNTTPSLRLVERRNQHTNLQQPPAASNQSHEVLRNLDDVSGRIEPTERPTTGAYNTNHDGDTRIPFWNIAHMINSIEQIDLALSSGANGIETDVSFNAKGIPTEAYHGFPCDCGRHCHFREQFIAFVRHLSLITNPPASSRLQLVLFDLKLKDLQKEAQLITAGTYLARILYQNLYSIYHQKLNIIKSAYTDRRQNKAPLQPPLRVIVSINHAKDLPLVKAFIGEIRSNHWDFMSQYVGFDVGMNDNLTDISSMWDQLKGATLNIWQGDGLTNCANLVRGVERLKEALSIRNNQGHFKKIYYWTADILYHIRSVLRLGVDAVLTNQPQRVLQVLDEPEFRSKYRLATPFDNPFEQYLVEPSRWQMSLPSLSETIETVQNLKKTSSDYIKTIPDGIGAAIKKVHATFV